MKQNKLLIITFILFSSVGIGRLYAGELSNFEIIGFSDNMKYFAFTEYGINTNTQPYANIHIINISQNTFIPNGKIAHVFPQTNSINETGIGALFSIFLQSENILTQYQINPINRGRIIYALLDSYDPGDKFSFVDYTTNYAYSVQLNQTIRGVGTSAEGAFFIKVDIKNKNTILVQKTVGNNSFYREGIAHYKIRSIYTTKNSNLLIFVIEKLSFDVHGETNIHYMVETVAW